MINPAIDEMAEHTSVKHACELMGRPAGATTGPSSRGCTDQRRGDLHHPTR